MGIKAESPDHMISRLSAIDSFIFGGTASRIILKMHFTALYPTNELL
jgi:hypothetical protein